MKILISTDTSCVLSYESLKKYNISIFPLNVIVDGEEFLDSVTINQEALKVDMRSNKKIQTSTPPLGEVISYFEKLFSEGYDHVIHFTISSGLSSMSDLFTNVAKQYFEGKVTIIDSLGLSTTMLSQVFTAYEDMMAGKSVEEIVKNVEARKNTSHVVFIPENLTALKNGGRISPTIALIGNIIGIKPVILLKDGALEKSEMTKKIKGTFVDRINALSKEFPTSEFDYSIMHFDGNPHVVQYICDHAKEILGDVDILVGNLSINVCAHCGPGTIGLIVSPKINGKSLYDFAK
jgi:DegV family protein with EDD domain